MNDPSSIRAGAATPTTGASPSAGEIQSAQFAQLVMQQSNMAFMLLGKIPDPSNGQMLRDLDSAKLFIDQLEMLEAKTQGNLTPPESGLLKQSLMALRMAFVEVTNSPATQPAKAAPLTTENQAAADANEKSPPAKVAGEDESTKRFSKKYS